jgi:hypothetical protein
MDQRAPLSVEALADDDLLREHEPADPFIERHLRLDHDGQVDAADVAPKDRRDARGADGLDRDGPGLLHEHGSVSVELVERQRPRHGGETFRP